MSSEVPGSQDENLAETSMVIVENDVGTTREEMLAAIDATIRPFSDGDLVKGKIVKIDQEEVLVDIGYKAEGVIPSRELSLRNDIDPRDVVKEGDEIEALILQMEDADGRMILSKKRAQYEKAWGKIQELHTSGGIVEGRVIEVVKGGLIVDVGVRGFLPASLVELRRVRDLQQYIGQEIECKIIELDRHRNNVVLSRRAFLEEAHSVQRREFLEDLGVGEVKKGTVSSIVNYGAFVDLGVLDGLVHVSELSWHHVDHPGEVVKVGDEIDVEILNVDLERDRVSLSLKNTQEDPWKTFAKTSQPGDLVEGKISRLVPFGAFVELSDGVEGLIHISELSDDHVELPEQVVAAGTEVSVKVLDVDLERRRISLSLKRSAEPAYTTGGMVAREGAEPTAELAPEGLAEGDLVPEDSPAEAPAEVQEPVAAEPVAEPDAPEPEAEKVVGGTPLDRVEPESDESLESIVEEMKREQPE